MLNMNPTDTFATLRNLHYRQNEIDNGLAVETLIKALSKRKNRRRQTE
jgi:hypothetical protein